ncbi:hypothetical protein K438DRAFT_2011307 [Mycena galopus ATCC 62051]|nr:hypothetical protein K438DRAFT_2011307 [Mycena galopus ATCC 62051]
MPLFNLFKAKSADPAPNQASFSQPAGSSGLLVASELDKALEECKTTVARTAKECRANNRKFRDIEFDIENDAYATLNGLSAIHGETYNPSDVRRVSQIFDTPQFFIDGANGNDIIQGALGDCWFLSALATMSTAEGLIEKRDEEIGVYGFIFFKDDHWVPVIIDDLLYTAIPKYEEFNSSEKALYHNDKELYNKAARKGSQTLYFAKSGTDGETWVPLIEKVSPRPFAPPFSLTIIFEAYAKLHGDYASLSGGYACEAIEDLTGGVSSYILSKDILDIDKFWTEEFMKANKDRLFGCYFQGLDSTRSGDPQAKIFGLIGNHAYSVLRASEWTGPWSDGSKEWNAEWLEILPILGHVFGDDGEFVMEYSDFLDCWDKIDRVSAMLLAISHLRSQHPSQTLLFDSNWITSSHWLRVSARSLPSAWTYGDVCFTVTIPKPSFTIIVLSQLDSRYFNDISGRSYWHFDFLLFKWGQTEPVANSSHPRFDSRSVKLELDLEAGDYIIHVRLDRMIRADREKVSVSIFVLHLLLNFGFLRRTIEKKSAEWDQRKLSRVLTMRAQSQSIASNFKAESQSKNLTIPVEALAGLNFADMEKKAIEKAEAQKKEAEAAGLLNPPMVTTTTTTTTTVTTVKKVSTSDAVAPTDSPAAADTTKVADNSTPVASTVTTAEAKPEPEDDNTIFMGLRVYTHKDGGAATIGGQLRHEMEATFANLGGKAT